MFDHVVEMFGALSDVVFPLAKLAAEISLAMISLTIRYWFKAMTGTHVMH